jgi:hypothetical protein
LCVQNLTGGTLLLRNKYYIVIYRGKDFLPTTVAAALAEREELTKDIQNIEEQRRCISVAHSPEDSFDGHALVGTLAEFQEAQARWGRDVTSKEQEEMKEASLRSEKEKLFRRLEHKFSIVSNLYMSFLDNYSFRRKNKLPIKSEYLISSLCIIVFTFFLIALVIMRLSSLSFSRYASIT